MKEIPSVTWWCSALRKYRCRGRTVGPNSGLDFSGTRVTRSRLEKRSIIYSPFFTVILLVWQTPFPFLRCEIIYQKKNRDELRLSVKNNFSSSIASDNFLYQMGKTSSARNWSVGRNSDCPERSLTGPNAFRRQDHYTHGNLLSLSKAKLKEPSIACNHTETDF